MAKKKVDDKALAFCTLRNGLIDGDDQSIRLVVDLLAMFDKKSAKQLVKLQKEIAKATEKLAKLNAKIAAKK
jgi:hypothetical protein